MKHSNNRIQATHFYVVPNDTLPVTKATLQIKTCFQDNPGRQRRKLAHSETLIRVLPSKPLFGIINTVVKVWGIPLKVSSPQWNTGLHSYTVCIDLHRSNFGKLNTETNTPLCVCVHSHWQAKTTRFKQKKTSKHLVKILGWKKSPQQ